ncbi:MAG TPA: DUF4350 domain-containing protein [Gemmatimonadales bacterium]|nr:DUF4350 domain-containing protein [Gemmatimonadales bacterium]
MSRRAEILMVLLLGVLLALAVWAGRRAAGPPPVVDSRASTLVSGPDGSRALYDILARLGVPVERRRTPLFDLATNTQRRPAALAVIDPPQDLVSAELSQVVQFVKDGGAVVAADRGGGISRCVGWDVAYRFDFMQVDSFRVVATDHRVALPAVTNYFRPPATGQGERDAARRLRGGEIEDSQCETLLPLAQDTLLRLLDGRPAALRLQYRGGGTVTLVADAGYFRNRAWRETPVPEFVTPLLVPAHRRGRLAWDEYHQRFGSATSLSRELVGWLLRAPTGWALLQLVALLLIGLALVGVRFGPARAVIERRRRSPIEHLEALAAGLEGAAGVDTSVALTVSSLRRRLGRTGVLAAGEERSWLAALELALPTAAGRNAVRRLQRILNQPGGPERALAAAQAVEDVWTELRPPKTRAGS